MNDIPTIKQIQLSNISEIKEKPSRDEKPIKTRVIVQTDKWLMVDTETQFNYIKNIANNIAQDDGITALIRNQIQQKLYGYRGQDIDKKIFDGEQFINLSQVISLIVKAENKCYYCKKSVHLLYDIVREPKQWTLDRINNKLGHNHNNVLLACLNCNLRRRTMHTERYVFTKQLNIVKQPE